MYNVILIELIKKDKEILLVKRSRNPGIGKWGLPAGNGALKDDRNPFTAINEEVKMDFHVASKASLFSVEFNPEEPSNLYIYFIVELLGEPKYYFSESFSEFKWFTIQEVLLLDLAIPFDKKIILKLN